MDQTERIGIYEETLHVRKYSLMNKSDKQKDLVYIYIYKDKNTVPSSSYTTQSRSFISS